MHGDPLLRALSDGKILLCENECEMESIFKYIFEHELPVGHATAELAQTDMRYLFNQYPIIFHDRRFIICAANLHSFLESGTPMEDVMHYTDFLELVGLGIHVDLEGLIDAVFWEPVLPGSKKREASVLRQQDSSFAG